MTDPSTMASERLAILTRNLEPYRRFAKGRLHSEDLADEALQEALLRAVTHVGTLQDDQRIEAWFWTILRRAIIDLATAQRNRSRHHGGDLSAVEADGTTAPDFCQCLRSAIDVLPAIHAQTLRTADLTGDDPAVVADRLGISSGALAVRRHRARAALGEALQQLCRTCATHGCLDCTCRRDQTAPEKP